jgi:DNA-binding transcriptional LysR family regulator
MGLNELTLFVKVVQLGSFTQAAEALGLQKAYVSRVITQLETKLAVRLLERTTRSLSLTEIGREVYERAIGILGAVEETKQLTQQLTREPRGVLRLTCGIEFGLLAVNTWMQGYLKRYPAVSIEADWTGRVVDIVHEGFDIAIRIGTLPDSSLIARRLGEIHYGLFVSRDYLKQQVLPLSIETLEQYPRLVFSGGHLHEYWQLSSGSEQVVIKNSARLAVNNYLALCEAALHGLGIALLPLLVAKPYVEAGQLMAILPEWTVEPMPVHALYASNRYLTPKVRAFIDHALAHFPR